VLPQSLQMSGGWGAVVLNMVMLMNWFKEPGILTVISGVEVVLCLPSFIWCRFQLFAKLVNWHDHTVMVRDNGFFAY
jgi:hypothetical protein